jgi:hypothetical protein
MESLVEEDLTRIRRTPDGLRIDGPGLVAALLGQRGHQGAPWKRLLEAYPDIGTNCTLDSFGRRGLRTQGAWDGSRPVFDGASAWGLVAMRKKSVETDMPQ